MSPTGQVAVNLRAYQEKAIRDARVLIGRKKKRILLCAPTGAGKTLTAGAVILGAREKKKRVLFVAHRKELIDQSVNALVRLGCSEIGVLRGSDKRVDLSQPIQVASIQTLARRKALEPPPDLIFIDECHRAASKGYQTYLYELYPDAVIIGLTATPCRGDGKPLDSAFDEIVPVSSYTELIALGFLAEPLVYSTPLLPDLTTVRTVAGDYSQEDLEAAVNRGALIGSVGDEWIKRANGRRTVVFAVSVAHSKAIVEMFRGLGVVAEHLDGETPEAEREAILARLESGTTQLVSNCDVLSEGWDQPSVKCLILTRPTKSLSRYMQQAGRCLRPWGEVKPIVLDHGGNVDRHGLPHIDRAWSLSAKATRSSEAPPMRVCPACFAYIMGVTRTCPHCDAELPAHIVESKKSAEPIPVDLQLRTIETEETDPRFRVFRENVSTCRRKGWHYGAAIHQFEGSYREPPPIAWIEALKKDFRRDREWKERVRIRREERAAREEAAA